MLLDIVTRYSSTVWKLLREFDLSLEKLGKKTYGCITINSSCSTPPNVRKREGSHEMYEI